MKSPVKPSPLSILGEPSSALSRNNTKKSAKRVPILQATPLGEFESLFDELAISSTLRRPWMFDNGDSGWDELDHASSIASSSCSSATSSVEEEEEDDDDEVVGNNDVRRVHFVETGPNEKDILRTEYKSTVDYDTIREQWYTAQHFRKFRALCQETAIAAAQDTLYCQDFLGVYNRVRNGYIVMPTPERANDGRLDFSDYRGLERAIFRQTLVTDKFSNIKSIVVASKELNESELAQVSHEFTATARLMARHLATLDRLVVDHGVRGAQTSNLPEPRQLLEI